MSSTAPRAKSNPAAIAVDNQEKLDKYQGYVDYHRTNNNLTNGDVAQFFDISVPTLTQAKKVVSIVEVSEKIKKAVEEGAIALNVLARFQPSSIKGKRSLADYTSNELEAAILGD